MAWPGKRAKGNRGNSLTRAEEGPYGADSGGRCVSADPGLPDDALRISSNVVEGPGGALVIALHGEVDLLTAPLVSEAVTAAAARHPTTLIIDLTAVTFLDSSGLSILAQAHTAASAGSQVRVVAPADGMPYRAMALTGLDKILTVFPSQTDALPPS
ncbi:anti-sigma factor antagonist [Amycolatopsis balhimycina DSM 5908]|uniref:Anti-sigma factor antagonist n=1 Tax=Amycolatopsis balhimycina DSM 5908 TaxID=1081091 RepID=A0A428VXG8_AMYBA|nr:anti-sigma factor antagonist [Amycolatopsis balhimycina DSM 5908]